MALTNAEKQALWRKRYQIVLTRCAEEIAAKLIGMKDQAKLRKIYKFVGNHLKNSNRSSLERPARRRLTGIKGLVLPLSGYLFQANGGALWFVTLW
jgi:hypothetical protein